MLSIDYLPKEKKFEVEHLNSWFATPTKTIFEPNQIMAYKGRSLNPFIGYKIEDADHFLGTETGKEEE